MVKLVDNFEAQWEYVANTATSFTFLTNLEAPRYRSVPPTRRPCRPRDSQSGLPCLYQSHRLLLCRAVQHSVGPHVTICVARPEISLSRLEKR